MDRELLLILLKKSDFTIRESGNAVDVLDLHPMANEAKCDVRQQ